MACGSEQALPIALSYIARGGTVGEVAGDELICPTVLAMRITAWLASVAKPRPQKERSIQ